MLSIFLSSASRQCKNYSSFNSIFFRRSIKSKMSHSPGPVEQAITEALKVGLSPHHLEVINESHMHGVPKGSESHFKVLVVSEKFEKTPLIKCHRMVNELVKNKLEDDFPHALSIVTKTPTQYDPSYKVEPSPNCRGGMGK